MNTEFPCENCQYIFSDQISFNIHLKNCETNKLKDHKQQYSCPVCNRQFRVLANLLRHEETKKHQNLIEWHKKQDPSIDPELISIDPNIKNIYVSCNLENENNQLSNLEDLTTIELETQSEMEISNDISQTIDLEPVETQNDEFLDNLMRENELSEVIDEVIDLNKDVLQSHEVTKIVIPSKSDPYLDNLLKER